MVMGKFNRYWTLITVILVVIIIIGGIVIWSKYSPGQPVEIAMPPAPEWSGRISIEGAVTSPGGYLFSCDDSLAALIRAAGGTTDSANLSGLRLYIPESGVEVEPQRVDINRAEVWLLEALPGIGPTLAQRIVDYREQNGPFHNTSEITRVAGIGEAIYEQVKHLVTIAD